MTTSVADSPLGDSSSIGPSAISTFRNWALLETMNSKIAYDPLVSFHNIEGKRLSGPKDFSKMLHSASADKIYRHSRPKFHSMLLQRLRDIGVEVEYDCKVRESFNETGSDQAGIVLRDGSRVVGDLVVAADGIRSKSWPLIAGREVPVRSSGDAVFRVEFSVELALTDPLIAGRFPLLENGRSNIELWQGTGVQVAFWRNEHEMSWSLSRPVSHPTCP
jgi:2-polyprenyl-6-methoxyphenol hydroxylase-like FAD-dependent oxidoreductase